MNARQHFAMLARYDLWATRRLFEHVDALPEADYRRDAGLFFKSVHGTLNHLLVAEQGLWQRRFAEGVSPSLKLDAELEPDRARLRERLIDGAAAWQPLIESWPGERLDEASVLEYTSTDGVARRLPFAAALAHVFDHGTHHRGQVTAAITAFGRACPELDLPWMLLAERKA